MKKILTILGTITIIGTSSTSLVACDKSPQYTEEELADLKEKNNIKTKNGILEWIAPQEKPFKEVDNKWYFVVWRYDENKDWNLVKFKNNTNANFVNAITLEKVDKYYLYLGNYFKPPLDIGAGLTYTNLYIYIYINQQLFLMYIIEIKMIIILNKFIVEI